MAAPGNNELPASVEAAWTATQGGAEGEQESVPFFVMLGLLGGERGPRALPSHAGTSLQGVRFEAPIASDSRSGMLQQQRGLSTGVGPNISTHTRLVRPGSADQTNSVQRRAARPGSAPARAAAKRQAPTLPRQQEPQASEPSPSSPPPYHPPPSFAAARFGPAPPPPRRRAAPKYTGPAPQTLDRVLTRELAYGRIGVASGHYCAPSETIPAPQTASIMRQRNKSKMRDITMIPTTLRAWESTVERNAALTRGTLPRGYVAAPAYSGGANRVAPRRAPSAAAESPSAAPSAAPQAESQAESQAAPRSAPKLTPYEMRRFLKHSQRYFLACGKGPFSVGSQAAGAAPAQNRGAGGTPGGGTWAGRAAGG